MSYLAPAVLYSINPDSSLAAAADDTTEALVNYLNRLTLVSLHHCTIHVTIHDIEQGIKRLIDIDLERSALAGPAPGTDATRLGFLPALSVLGRRA